MGKHRKTGENMGKQKKKTEENVEKQGKTGRIKGKYRKTGEKGGKTQKNTGKQRKHRITAENQGKT